MKLAVATAVVLPFLAACSPDSTSEHQGSDLSRSDIATAQAAARDVIAEQTASVSSASVVVRAGTSRHTNTGHPCTSGRELEVQLIGRFPRIVTTGHPVLPGSPTPDFTVRAMTITVDARSGVACVVGVQTAENGEVEALPGGTPLALPST